METQVLYNSVNPFEGLSPTPLVGKSDSIIKFHDRWAAKSTITLNGSITGSCGDGYVGLTDKQKVLIQRFSEDFKPLTIVEDGSTIYTAPYVTVDSIKFDSNPYVRLLPYTVSLSCYQQNLFSGVYGVSEPTNKINWSEGEDGIVTITRTLGAKGFNTSSNARTNNALTNAKSYVQSITGFNSSYFAECLPAFIKYDTGVIPCIKEIKENVDRLSATYSVDETYKYDSKSKNSYILKYSTEFNYDDQEGIYKASINGTLEGCQYMSMADLRATYKTLDLYSMTQYEYKKCYPTAADLNPEYLSDSVSEKENIKTIEFSRNWDSDPRGLVLFDYSIKSDYSMLDDTRVISLDGTITSRGSQKVMWQRVMDYYNNLNIFNIVQDFYIGKGYPYQLVKLPTSYTATENEFDGTISINASYSDKIQPPNGFDDADYTISITPSVNQIIPVPVLCGKYYLIDIKSLKRANISVDGNLKSLSSSAKVEDTRNFANVLLLNYLPVNTKRVLKSDKVSYNKSAQMYDHSFERSESFMGAEFNL